MPPLIVAITGSLLIIAIESLLWRLFRTRIEGLLFPRKVDGSALHFFSIGRVRACVIAHTGLLIAVCVLMIFFFW